MAFQGWMAPVHYRVPLLSAVRSLLLRTMFQLLDLPESWTQMFLQKGYAGCMDVSCPVLLSQPASKPASQVPPSSFSYAYEGAAFISGSSSFATSACSDVPFLLLALLLHRRSSSGFFPRFFQVCCLLLIVRHVCEDGPRAPQADVTWLVEGCPPPGGPLRLDREIGGASPFRSMTSSPWQKVAPPLGG
ncbi:hypothetical protein TRV_01689 [Trichophyton verrucosum HKI 0517]|uniref:Uncharacterized protein n=1 Tax=Trichophyton verrucosum (strain HKI 0517) TaxID=663202 RepID=D4D3M9_TRIVH|nr:uncharacterized protein TRV_01689 [Trichophyton verrucosum HKI 0517]EFE43579.1 hypothetical protein TRV_01689 [Trichophyton verrucosum HKI 0517]